MRTIRKFILMTLSLTASLAFHAQSPLWLVGSNYLDQNFQEFIIPTGPDPTIDYQGQQAEYAANAWHNPADGSLLFFIVDGVVYDGDGYRINKLTEDGSTGNMRGVSEISIVPDPSNCMRFYIFGSSMNKGFLDIALDEDVYEPVFSYAILDLSIARVFYNTSRQGDLIQNSYYNIYNLIDLIPSNLINEFSGYGADMFAISPKTNGNAHYIFYQSPRMHLFVFRLDENGIAFVANSAYNVQTGSAPSSVGDFLPSRSELEVAVLPNGNYRVVGKITNPTPYFLPERLYKVDYSPSGNPIANSYANYAFPTLDLGGWNWNMTIKGIEISPNTNLIYITKTIHPDAPEVLMCFESTNLTNIPLPSFQQNTNMQYSMLEVKNNEIYLARENGIYRIINWDNPSVANISTPIIPFSANLNLAVMGRLPSVANRDQRFGLYLLPDQMDFDPSFSEPEELTCECCFVFSKPTVFQPWIGHHNYVVSTSQTWTPGIGNNPFNSVNGVVEFNGNLIISPGVVLTIEGMTLKFGQSSRVIVERDIFPVVDGASLITENTTFTVLDECNECLWPGIEVQGHHDLPHTSSKHARVYFGNSTLIEHAYFGVIAGRIAVPDQVGQGLSLNAAGGVIETDFATFRNNRTDVHFIPYSFIATESILRDTKFITDAALRLPESQLANLNHVVINENMGIRLSKCTFDNETIIETDGVLSRGVGIKSFNSHYVVGGCFFRHLEYGIRAENANSALPFQVGSSHFIKNFTGVFAFNVMSLSITESQFEIFNSFPNSGVSTTKGIVLTRCNRYRVEGNSFYDISQTHPTAQTYGVVVSNSGPFPNVIEKNTFGFLHSAGISRNINAEDYTVPNSNLRGLKWLCNDFYDNKVHDLWVSSGRIAPWQVIMYSVNNLQLFGPAGNRFFTSENPDYHVFLSGGVPAIRYFYSSNSNEEPTLISTNNVIKVNVNIGPNFNLCDQGRPGDDGLLTEEDMKDLRLQLIEEKQTAKLLLDYSDKDSTINQVLSEYLTAQQKRDLLMTGTTIISDEVLIKYIESNPPHTMLYQVLVHNSPLTDKVIFSMMEESNLTSGMKQQILSIQSGLPENETLLNYIQNIELNVQYIEAKLANSFIGDSLNLRTPNDVVSLLMDNPYLSNADLELLFHASVDAKNQYLADSLNTILKSINQDWEYEVLSDLAVATIGSYYYDVIHDDSLLIAQLEEIADFSDYMYAYPARAILSGVLGYKFEYPEDEEFGNRSALLPRYTYDGAPLDLITIFPNPASDHFFIVFDENAAVSQRHEARIYDLAGNLQFTRSFDDNAYVLEINTEHMTQGLYIVVISENGTDIGTYKVAVR